MQCTINVLLTKPTQQNLKFPKEWKIGVHVGFILFYDFFILIKAEKNCGDWPMCLMFVYTIYSE